jgi:hypothetical protein
MLSTIGGTRASIFWAGDFSGIFVRDPSPVPNRSGARVETFIKF